MVFINLVKKINNIIILIIKETTIMKLIFAIIYVIFEFIINS